MGVGSVTYLALDPGWHTGWALFDANGEKIQSGLFLGIDMFEDFLDHLGPSHIIYEDYIHRPWTPQGGSKHHAAQVIGACKAWAKRNGCKTTEQPNTVKPIAYKWAGLKKKSHENDAIAHGIYYLQKNGIRKSRLIR